MEVTCKNGGRLLDTAISISKKNHKTALAVHSKGLFAALIPSTANHLNLIVSVITSQSANISMMCNRLIHSNYRHQVTTQWRRAQQSTGDRILITAL